MLGTRVEVVWNWIANAGSNEASRELYKACGFRSWHMIDDYSKPIPPQSEG